MGVGWKFPSNNNSEIIGIGEAGIETFKGSLFGSLAREICQNSLDARNDYEKPVRIDFILNCIDREYIPGIETLTDTMRSCKEFWKENSKTVKFFDKAQKVCQGSRIRVLRISDYNTTGLTGSDKLKSSAWQDLVKSSGVSNKNGESGGSFGIGKSAPYACSDLRTIFYSTLDIHGLKAFQGVARLVSFRSEEEENGNDITQGKGYYGHTKDNSCIRKVISLDGYERKEVGTDLYVLGFVENEFWRDEIIKELIDGYLISILEDDLVVRVDDFEINSDNIHSYIEKYKEDIPLAYNYYQVLTEEGSTCILEEFEGLGKVELKILIKKDFKRKVLMARNNGMKIFDKKNISATIPFAGVCILRDKKINEFFREMENPQHNNWEPERHSDEKKAKKMRQKLFSFIKDKIFETGRTTILDEMDAVGAGEFVPDLETASDSGDSRKETIGNEIKNYSQIEKVASISSQKGTQSTEDLDIMGEEETFGDLDGTSEDEGIVYYHTNKNTRYNEGVDENCNVSLSEEGKVPTKRSASVKPLKLRLFMYDRARRIYKLTFEPQESVDDAYIEISASGEQSKADIEVNNAMNEDKILLAHEKNRIFIGNIRKGVRYSFLYGTKYKEMCSMEVAVHGYKI
ncbi:MAG: hypothetical protein Q3993_05790 [Filifactor alocis]|nr:hypothetical protein [Filifactor alocis]